MNECVYFYIQNTPEFDEAFYKLSTQFLDYSITLIPIHSSELVEMIKLTKAEKIVFINSTRNSVELVQFMKQLRPLLPILLKSTRYTLFHLSSFKKANQSHGLRMIKNYHFISYPVSSSKLCAIIYHYIQAKLKKTRTWPGGRRVSLKYVE